MHKYVPKLIVPTKKDKFDWTLGSGINQLRDDYDAEYALFIHIRDSYTSAGRVAVIFVAAVFGVGVQGGTQVGFASLVDLGTGDVVWFNRLFSATGDLRTAAPAGEAIKQLLSEFPL